MLRNNMTHNIVKSVLYGILATAILLGIYFIVLTFVSGWGFAQNQFGLYWYFITSLAVGFGFQIGLYEYLKALVHRGQGASKVIGVSGVTSTTSMISCCAHYLANVIPILGVTGLTTFVTQYQIKIFWVGLVFNILGIVFMSNKIIKFKKHP